MVSRSMEPKSKVNVGDVRGRGSGQAKEAVDMLIHYATKSVQSGWAFIVGDSALALWDEQ